MKKHLLFISLFTVPFWAYADTNEAPPQSGLFEPSTACSVTTNNPERFMQKLHTINTVSPLTGRADAVGGIESITIDGKRYYFGFDFSNDLVVSPLIVNIDTMAAFASQHMRQRDGSHDACYWRELAVESIEFSGLSDDEGSRDFSSRLMRKIVGDLKTARMQNSKIPDFSIEYHIIYLLNAAIGWQDIFDDPDIMIALKKLKIAPLKPGEDYFDESIEMLSGYKALPADTTYADAALVIQKSLNITVDMAPANWKEVFYPLTSY